MHPVNWSSPVNWRNILNRGLLSWYLTSPHKVGGSSSWNDLVSNVDGTLTNMESADWVGPQGRPGGWGALNLDGDPEFITRSPPLTAPPFTFAAWVLGDSILDFMRICSLNNTSTPSRTMNIAMDDNGKFIAQHFDGIGNEIAQGTTTMVVGRWYHVCGTFPTINSRSIYVNGKKEDTNANAQTSITVNHYTIGRQDPGTQLYWDGRIDDVRLWNRGLSRAEVQELYQDSKQGYPRTLNRLHQLRGAPVVAPPPPQPAPPPRFTPTKPIPGADLGYCIPINRGLLGWWLFNEGAGSRIADISGKGNRGTITNVDLKAGWKGSPQGGALVLDGFDDHIVMPRSSLRPLISLSVVGVVNGSGVGALDYVLTHYNATGDQRAWAIQTSTESNGMVVVLSGDGTINEGSTKNYFTSPEFVAFDKTWHQIGFTFDGPSSTLKLYVDGRHDVQAGATVDDAITSLHDSTSDVVFGAHGGVSGHWDGSLSDVRIYDRALSTREMRQLYVDSYVGLMA